MCRVVMKMGLGRMARALHEMVRTAAERGPSAAAVTDRSGTTTYAELWDAILRAAGGLSSYGLDRGDRVAVFLDKRTENVIAMLAASAVGAVFVPVNPVLKPQQVDHILTNCSARCLVTTSERLSALLASEAGAGPDIVVLVDDGPVAGEVSVGTVVARWSELLSADASEPSYRPVDSDLAAILYTSGSTGLPKGVVLSHRNLVVGAESVSEYLANTAQDVILAALPLSFDAGLSQVTTALHVGAHVVLVNYLLAGDIVRLCAQHGVTGLTCVPPLWIQLGAATWPPEATRTLRYFANTGGRMPKSTLARLRTLFPAARPFLMYGLTEAFRSTYLDPDEVDQRPDSIGRAIPNAEVLVVRPDGSRCEPGEPGELVHRGPLVAQGYWNDPVRTAERFRALPSERAGVVPDELAVWSGDTVMRDEDGFLYFVGRRDEMIKTSGYRVSPSEVEEAAYDTGLVRDAVVFGVDDEVLGQQIVLVAAAVRPDCDPEEVVGALRARLPLFMVPRRVVLQDDLPRSPNGKFDRTALRALVTV
ncbi:acyl-CoA ligase (AMP-forming), exosortase A system-associated [Flexivirga alba]|uniref:Acyl-CoA ligase (AMP-forming), exosortase A system-associated n=1 Tax=Flexivirga alba TaxID=702742 RepID=A0ABW2AGC9_9MICO